MWHIRLRFPQDSGLASNALFRADKSSPFRCDYGYHYSEILNHAIGVTALHLIRSPTPEKIFINDKAVFCCDSLLEKKVSGANVRFANHGISFEI